LEISSMVVAMDTAVPVSGQGMGQGVVSGPLSAYDRSGFER